jgi:hypothetical protein
MTEDSSIGGPAEGRPQPPGDVRQALGEVDPQPGSGVHEVVLPKGSCGRSRRRTSRQLHG